MNIWTLCDIYDFDAKDFEKFLREKNAYLRYKDIIDDRARKIEEIEGKLKLK